MSATFTLLDTSPAAVSAAVSRFNVGSTSSRWNAMPQTPDEIAVNVGTALAFAYSASHNVWQFPDGTAFTACDFSRAVELGGTAHGGGTPGSLANLLVGTVTEPDRNYYFACEISGHCIAGQKLAVIVTVAPPSPPTAPSPPTLPTVWTAAESGSGDVATPVDLSCAGWSGSTKSCVSIFGRTDVLRVARDQYSSLTNRDYSFASITVPVMSGAVHRLSGNFFLPGRPWSTSVACPAIRVAPEISYCSPSLTIKGGGLQGDWYGHNAGFVISLRPFGTSATGTENGEWVNVASLFTPSTRQE